PGAASTPASAPPSVGPRAASGSSAAGPPASKPKRPQPAAATTASQTIPEAADRLIVPIIRPAPGSGSLATIATRRQLLPRGCGRIRRDHQRDAEHVAVRVALPPRGCPVAAEREADRVARVPVQARRGDEPTGGVVGRVPVEEGAGAELGVERRRVPPDH